MSEIVAEGSIRADRLTQYLEAVHALVEEGRVHWNDDGLATRVVDPANVAMIRPATLSVSAFDDYDAPGSVTVGLSFGRFLDLLNAAKKEDIVHIAVDMESRKLRIEYRNISHTMALIDPDSIRGEPDNPELDLPNEVVIEARHLTEAFTQIELISDHLRIRADPDDELVEIYGLGDTDETHVTFDGDQVIMADVTTEAESLFSLPYMQELSKPMPNTAEVRIRFGDEFPMTFDWEALDGDVTVHQMCAPRIETH